MQDAVMPKQQNMKVKKQNLCIFKLSNYIKSNYILYFTAFASACPARACSLPFRQLFRPQLCWETGTTPLALAVSSVSLQGQKMEGPQTAQIKAVLSLM